MNKMLTIGKVAMKAGVNTQTVRYYERRGLLNPDSRNDSGYRFFSAEAPKKIRFIKNAQELGFSLKEISSLLKLKVNNRARCGDIKKKAEMKIKDVQSRITKLKAIESVLQDLIRTCRSQATTDRCPILRSLDH